MEKTISIFLTILTLGFAQQIFAQDENASADDPERWSDFLPLNKEMAGDADLPLPFGIGITGYWQEQDLKAKSIGFKSDLTNLLANLLLAEDPAGPVFPGTAAGLSGMLVDDTINAEADATNVESEVDNWNIRLDAWLMPFLNIYGVYGEVEGENKASGLTFDAPSQAVLAATGLSLDPFNFTYEGDVYGFGIIFAGQWGKYWGTLDYNYMQADLDISTSEIDTHTITPRIGTSGSIGSTKGSLWIGAMHQSIDEVQTGTIPVAGVGVIDYNVLLEQENEWNFLLGGTAELSKGIHVGVEGGFGERKQVMGNLTFRF
jgi:hypothetical protein